MFDGLALKLEGECVERGVKKSKEDSMSRFYIAIDIGWYSESEMRAVHELMTQARCSWMYELDISMRVCNAGFGRYLSKVKT